MAKTEAQEEAVGPLCRADVPADGVAQIEVLLGPSSGEARQMSQDHEWEPLVQSAGKKLKWKSFNEEANSLRRLSIPAPEVQEAEAEMSGVREGEKKIRLSLSGLCGIRGGRSDHR